MRLPLSLARTPSSRYCAIIAFRRLISLTQPVWNVLTTSRCSSGSTWVERALDPNCELPPINRSAACDNSAFERTGGGLTAEDCAGAVAGAGNRGSYRERAVQHRRAAARICERPVKRAIPTAFLLEHLHLCKRSSKSAERGGAAHRPISCRGCLLLVPLTIGCIREGGCDREAQQPKRAVQ